MNHIQFLQDCFTRICALANTIPYMQHLIMQYAWHCSIDMNKERTKIYLQFTKKKVLNCEVVWSLQFHYGLNWNLCVGYKHKTIQLIHSIKFTFQTAHLAMWTFRCSSCTLLTHNTVLTWVKLDCDGCVTQETQL